MSFDVTILGCSSATPTIDRHPSAQVVNIRETLLLVDCGESTQNQLLRYRISHQRIKHVFISHLHGDHYLGLNGLLATMNFQGREEDLHIYGPSPLEKMIHDHFEYSGTRLRFGLYFHKVSYQGTALLCDEEDFTVESIVLRHRIPTTGFIFREKKGLRHIHAQACREFDIPFAYFQELKEGKDYTAKNGRIIPNHQLTTDADEPRSYAYVSDTRYFPQLAQEIAGISLLYHESTFLHELLDRAEETLHTTAYEAGCMARLAKVKQLLLGHFSARYRDLTLLMSEARENFENTKLAIEGEKFNVD
jgi:ribonuclease Z